MQGAAETPLLHPNNACPEQPPRAGDARDDEAIPEIPRRVPPAHIHIPLAERRATAGAVINYFTGEMTSCLSAVAGGLMAGTFCSGLFAYLNVIHFHYTNPGILHFTPVIISSYTAGRYGMQLGRAIDKMSQHGMAGLPETFAGRNYWAIRMISLGATAAILLMVPLCYLDHLHSENQRLATALALTAFNSIVHIGWNLATVTYASLAERETGR